MALKDEYCDLSKLENLFVNELGTAATHIRNAKDSVKQALHDLNGDIPDCTTWVNPTGGSY